MDFILTLWHVFYRFLVWSSIHLCYLNRYNSNRSKNDWLVRSGRHCWALFLFDFIFINFFLIFFWIRVFITCLAFFFFDRLIQIKLWFIFFFSVRFFLVFLCFLFYLFSCTNRHSWSEAFNLSSNWHWHHALWLWWYHLKASYLLLNFWSVKVSLFFKVG